MIKFMIMFQQPADLNAFENAYQDFLALIERMPNILRRQVVHVTGSPQGTPKYYRILEIYFESLDKQQEALMSSIGQEAGKELVRFPSGMVELLFADVYEEDGGSTPIPDEPVAETTETTSPANDEATDHEPEGNPSDVDTTETNDKTIGEETDND